MFDNTTLGVDYTTLGICMTSFVLQKMSHPLYHTKRQSLWLHIHFRHDITSCIIQRTNCIFVITISPRISHPLLCDIIPTICLTSYALYITSYPILMSSHYLWQHKLDIWNHIQYAVQNIHYPCDITVTSLCHHTHCIESITPTLCMTSHSA